MLSVAGGLLPLHGPGGVTSSSLEVLCALALTDEEFRTHMSTGVGGKPADVRAFASDVCVCVFGFWL